jgi:hypothetical protein
MTARAVASTVSGMSRSGTGTVIGFWITTRLWVDAVADAVITFGSFIFPLVANVATRILAAAFADGLAGSLLALADGITAAISSLTAGALAILAALLVADAAAGAALAAILGDLAICSLTCAGLLLAYAGAWSALAAFRGLFLVAAFLTLARGFVGVRLGGEVLLLRLLALVVVHGAGSGDEAFAEAVLVMRVMMVLVVMVLNLLECFFEGLFQGHHDALVDAMMVMMVMGVVMMVVFLVVMLEEFFQGMLQTFHRLVVAGGSGLAQGGFGILRRVAVILTLAFIILALAIGCGANRQAHGR